MDSKHIPLSPPPPQMSTSRKNLSPVCLSVSTVSGKCGQETLRNQEKLLLKTGL